MVSLYTISLSVSHSLFLCLHAQYKSGFLRQPLTYIQYLQTKLHDVKYFLNVLFIHDFGTISLTSLTISLTISWVYRAALSTFSTIYRNISSMCIGRLFSDIVRTSARLLHDIVRYSSAIVTLLSGWVKFDLAPQKKVSL